MSKGKLQINEYNINNSFMYEKILNHYLCDVDGCKTIHKKYQTVARYLTQSKNYNYDNFLKYLFVNPSPYCIEKYMYLHDITYEEAEQIVREYKTNKATSLDNYIKKHGVEKGTQLFNEFKNKTLAKHFDVNLWIQEFGDDYGTMLFSLYKRISNIRCIEYWLHNYDITYNKALELQTEYQKKNSGVHKEYYISRNLPVINYDNQKGRTPSTGTIRQRIITRHEAGQCTHPDSKHDWQKYKNKVAVLTRQEPLYLLENWDLYKSNTDLYQIDHQVSIVYGFNNNIPEEIIASIHNLKIITAEENIKKNYRCSMDVQDLIRIYNENNQRK